jgi:hypothetical protein
MPTLIFTCDGYDFYRDGMGFWNVVHKGDPAPKHCAYESPVPIARLKGCDLRNILWTTPKTEDSQ